MTDTAAPWREPRPRSTRAGFLRAALAGGAIAAGGAAIGARGDGSSSAAEPSRALDVRILNFFLALEQAQEDLYRAALAADGIDGPLRRYASVVVAQEREHTAFLRRHLGAKANAHKTKDVGAAATSPARFRDAAITLEEAAIAAYIGQSANLTRPMVAAIAPLVSVEARQVAWLRDLAGISPAPRAQDPPQSAQAVLADLRKRGLLK